MNHFDVLNFVNDINRVFLFERKNNYVHKIQNLSKKVIHELFKKMPGEGTGVERVFNYMKDMLDSKRKSKYVTCSIGDIINPYTNRKIPIRIYFTYNKYTTCDISGEVSFSLEKSKNEINPYIERVKIVIEFNEDFGVNENSGKGFFIKTLYNVILHELAHAHDENLIIDELAPTKRQSYGMVDNYERFSKLKQFLLYHTDPSEIRSRMNECFLQIKNNKKYSAKKQTKKFYKKNNGDKNKTKGYNFIVNDREKRFHDSSRAFEEFLATITDYDDISEKFGYTIIDFIGRYCVAFVRDYSEESKRRYYDPLFKNNIKEFTIPPLHQMDEFLDVLLNLCDKFDSITSNSINNALLEGLFDSPIFYPIFESCDAKKLQEASNKLIKSFK